MSPSHGDPERQPVSWLAPARVVVARELPPAEEAAELDGAALEAGALDVGACVVDGAAYADGEEEEEDGATYAGGEDEEDGARYADEDAAVLAAAVSGLYAADEEGTDGSEDEGVEAGADTLEPTETLVVMASTEVVGDPPPGATQMVTMSTTVSMTSSVTVEVTMSRLTNGTATAEEAKRAERARMLEDFMVAAGG